MILNSTFHYYNSNANNYRRFIRVKINNTLPENDSASFSERIYEKCEESVH